MSELRLLHSEAPGAGRIRERELAGGAVVLAAARAVAGGAAAGAASSVSATAAAGTVFLLRRAAAEAGRMESSAVRRPLRRAVQSLDAGDTVEAVRALGCYGGVLERHGLWDAGAAAHETALVIRPQDAESALHAARCHRLAGRREAALALYAQVRTLSRDTRLHRFTQLGEALLADDPEAALTAILSEADAAGDHEAVAVGLEERARLRRAAGAVDGAVDDLIAAIRAFADAQDRVRVAHALADLLIAHDDHDGAREALCAALDFALPAQRAHVVQRLRGVARVQRDELGLRRWPGEGPSPLVSMMPSRRAGRVSSCAPRLRRMRDELALTGG